MMILYPEIKEEWLRKIEELVPGIELDILNEFEHLMFSVWTNGYETAVKYYKE